MPNAAHSLHSCIFMFKRAASQDLNLSFTSHASVQYSGIDAVAGDGEQSELNKTTAKQVWSSSSIFILGRDCR